MDSVPHVLAFPHTPDPQDGSALGPAFEGTVPTPTPHAPHLLCARAQLPSAVLHLPAALSAVTCGQGCSPVAAARRPGVRASGMFAQRPSCPAPVSQMAAPLFSHTRLQPEQGATGWRGGSAHTPRSAPGPVLGSGGRGEAEAPRGVHQVPRPRRPGLTQVCAPSFGNAGSQGLRPGNGGPREQLRGRDISADLALGTNARDSVRGQRSGKRCESHTVTGTGPGLAAP